MKASELKKGMIIKEGAEFYIVVDMDHKTPGNLRAIYQATLKGLLNPRIVNRRFSPSDTVEKADLEAKKMQYLYEDHAGFHFMDMETYETLTLQDDMVGDTKNYMKESSEVSLLFYKNKPVSIELPLKVNLKVTEAQVALRGDTVGSAKKQVTLETGLKINVPIFIKEGETIQVDTTTGEYLGRS